MRGQHNVRASSGDSTVQNTDKGHTPNPGIGIKITNPAKNRIRASELEDRDSTNHATATDVYQSENMHMIWNKDNEAILIILNKLSQIHTLPAPHTSIFIIGRTHFSCFC